MSTEELLEELRQVLDDSDPKRLQPNKPLQPNLGRRGRRKLVSKLRLATQATAAALVSAGYGHDETGEDAAWTSHALQASFRLKNHRRGNGDSQRF